MTRLFIYCITATLLFASCRQHEKVPGTARHAKVSPPAAVNYDSCKKKAIQVREQYRLRWDHMPRSEKEKIFTQTVAETIIPGWIGTAWSFNGTSQSPQKGSIACGYFVTTVLQDAGVRLSRTRLAQCASEQMITTLVQPTLIRRFSNLPMTSFLASVQQQGYGLYIVGLDNHTGFIYNDGKETWFIHSTFVGTRNVQKEKAAASWVLSSSKYKVLGKISADERILSGWVANTND
jgi:hypothetical protein